MSRFRRQIAVLTALAMVASVLVAVPAVAADPKADYTATFDACVGVGSSDFEDVPTSHANAGDIDCIAYYGITKGTSATTYSPLMSVTREQMALFLMRLAGKVGISINDDPDDPGFSDTGDLSAESQMAIAQLADLGITKGTSGTTYSPADDVSRGQMALFIARLMNKMTPQADGKIGLSSTTQYGYTPSDVVDNDMDADIGSPFTDVSGQTPKEQYDAITQLYELGVATGVSDTSYSPDADITRAAMAGFMSAVMDHSNLRPAGLSIQSNQATVWGDTEPVVVASFRSDTFGAVEEQAIDVFSSASSDKALRDDGTCNFGDDPDDVLGGDLISGDCVWDTNDDSTDKDGNLFVGETDIDAGTTRTFFAWVGDSDGQKFDDDRVDQVTVAVTAKKAQESLMPDSDINEKALDLYGMGQVVDLRADSSVTATATLKDEDGNTVEREGVSIRVHYQRGSSYTNTHEVILTTDAEGKVSYPVTGPSNTSATNDRADIVEFVELDSDGAATDRTAELKIHWIEEDVFLASDSITLPDYVLKGTPSVSIRVHQWDQYGNPYRSHSRQQTAIRVTGTDEDGTTALADIGTADGEQGNLMARRQVISRGYSSWSPRVVVDAEDAIAVAYDVRQLARNSKGAAVRTANAQPDDAPPNVVVGADLAAQFAEWVGFGTSSAQSRMTVVDALRTTYNDARVLIRGAAGTLGTADDILHPDEIDDDAGAGNADATPVLTDYASPRGDNTTTPDPTVGSTDPFVYGAPRNAPSGYGAEWSGILNAMALDTYQDYEGETKTAQGLVDTPVPVDLTADNTGDGSGSVLVVEKADSADRGRYNVDLVGKASEATEFLADTEDATNDADPRPELVFSFDDDDIYIDNTKAEGRIITMKAFRNMLKDSTTSMGLEVEVLTYDIDGVSTFVVKSNTPTG
ncbi:MAG: S-layer homology domain-containing protein [bacterium]|nr:S-layer homology domain-containing protein [bacterium]